MQKKPDYLNQLLEAASAAAGSDYALAKALEVSRFTVSDWRHGRKKCPAADVALMAEIAGMDAEAWLSRATVAQYEGTPKGVKLAQVLGKALAATGAAVASSGANASEMVSHFIRCILC